MLHILLCGLKYRYHFCLLPIIFPSTLQLFVKHFQKKFGRFRATDDPIETAYFSVYLFAAAVLKAQSDEVDAIRQAASGISIDAPEGRIRIDPDNRHAHRFARIGKLGADGQFSVVWSSDTTLKAEPFPKYRSEREWQTFLDDQQKRWQGKWGASE